MSELAAAGHHHREAVPVGGFDDFRVADGPAGLDDRGHAGRRGSLDAVRACLKVRLYHTDYREQMGESGLIHRVPAEGLIETLVYDLPGSVRTVPPDHVVRWGLPTEELFRIGLDNVKAERPPPALQTFEVGKSADIRALVGDSFFTASHVLFLEDHLRPPLPFGAPGIPLGHEPVGVDVVAQEHDEAASGRRAGLAGQLQQVGIGLMVRGTRIAQQEDRGDDLVRGNWLDRGWRSTMGTGGKGNEHQKGSFEGPGRCHVVFLLTE